MKIIVKLVENGTNIKCKKKLMKDSLILYFFYLQRCEWHIDHVNYERELKNNQRHLLVIKWSKKIQKYYFRTKNLNSLLLFKKNHLYIYFNFITKITLLTGQGLYLLKKIPKITQFSNKNQFKKFSFTFTNIINQIYSFI